MQWDDIPPVLNYLYVHAPGHPLARSRGQVLLHRWLVYRRVGPGPHPCHWCGTLLDWAPTDGLAAAIVVDHVDGNRGNNDDENLVVACTRCNTVKRRDALRPDEPRVVLTAGRTRAVDRTCVECGTAYLTRRKRAATARYCSRPCQWKAEGRGKRLPDDEPHVVQRNADGSVKARVRAVELTCERCAAPFLVDQARLRKGRARFCSKSCSGKTVAVGPRPASRGGRNHHAALTEDDVREMRRLWAAGGITLAALGARFGVSKSGANMVVYRRSWKHVE